MVIKVDTTAVEVVGLGLGREQGCTEAVEGPPGGSVRQGEPRGGGWHRSHTRPSGEGRGTDAVTVR